MTYDEFIRKLSSALKCSGARSLYFPMNKSKREIGVMRLAREVGFGLKGYPDRVKDFNGLYSQLVVSNAFDSIGPVVDAGPWLKELREAAGVNTKGLGA